MKKYYIKDIQALKTSNQKFATITAYDYLSAKIIDELSFPLILVGDSASMVVYGYDDTTPISMDEMLLVLRAVVKGAKHSLIVADMPFMSYQPSIEHAIQNAGTLIKNGANAVKVEGGGSDTCDRVRAIVDSGIPVVGHIGLMPQSINITSGYSVQGKTEKHAKIIIKEAQSLNDAGIFALVLEGIPADLAAIITKQLSIPTIGIGSGKNCDGQIQVFHDVVGLYSNFIPKHAKQYLNGFEKLSQGLRSYKDEVEAAIFPNNKHCIQLDKTVLKKISENN